MTIKFGILGAGRIGQVHCRAVASTDGAEIVAVADPNQAAAQMIADSYGADINSIDEIADRADIDAVIICTPTDMHADQIEQFAKKGKAIFCEKPIDLDIARVRDCLATVQEQEALLMVGFNRRFDPHFAALKQSIDDGQIGALEMGVIVSRDPAAPPADYILRSGGIFKDMTIHDFDMAVFLMGDMPDTVFATGSVLTDKAIEPLGDYDSASVILTWADGRQLSISNSRRASYGYDQRIEIHGEKGMACAENQRPVSIEVATQDGFRKPALHDFFMTRYLDAYAAEIKSFIAAIANGSDNIPTGIDGLNALLIAEAALESAKTGRAISLGKA